TKQRCCPCLTATSFSLLRNKAYYGKALFIIFGTGTGAARKCSPHQRHLCLLVPSETFAVIWPHRKKCCLKSFAVEINYEVSAGLFSAANRCFPRARLQPPCPDKGYAGVVRKGRF